MTDLKKRPKSVPVKRISNVSVNNSTNMAKDKRYSKDKRDKSNRVLEKVIVAVFLIFVIVATIILFRVPSSSNVTSVTGKTIASVQLDKTSYNASERIRGIITLEMEQGDIMPRGTMFEIFVATNVPECQANYICPGGIPVQWHKYDASTGQCVTVNPDPASTCCLMAGAGCGQVILNSKFNAPIDYANLPAWMSFVNGIDMSGVGIENFEIINPYTGEIKTLFKNALFLDTSVVTYSLNETFASVKQLLTIGNREVAIKDLIPSNERVEIQGLAIVPCYKAEPPSIPNGTEATGYAVQVPSPRPCNNNATYNATMYVYEQAQPTATYAWTSSNTSVASFVVPSGRTVTLNAKNPGITTIQVNATAQGKTAIGYRSVCVYRTNPIECTKQPIIETTYSTGELSKFEKIQPGSELSFDGVSSISVSSISSSSNKELYFQGMPGPTTGGMNWSLAYFKPDMATAACAFEVVLKGRTPQNAERNLHYWYTVTPGVGCNMPQSSMTDKYISKPKPLYENNVTNYSVDVVSDWISTQAGSWAGSLDDVITEVHLVSRGYFNPLTSMIYGQRVYFDNVELKKYGAQEAPTQCPKMCCTNGTGIGTYYGEQYSCAGEKICYDRCAFSSTKSFEALKSLSTTPNKFNTTQGMCKVVVDGVEVPLIDFCYSGGGQGVAGEGYTACLDVTNNSPRASCRGWDNIYTINLSRAEFNLLQAPTQNGSYELKLRLSYNHTMPGYNCSQSCLNHGQESCRDYCLIKEVSANFFVGIPGAVQCPDEHYDCSSALVVFSNWSDCISGTQTRTKTSYNCTYTGPQACPRYKDIITIETQQCAITVPCTEVDYSCDPWQPELCSPQSTQMRACQLTSTTCNPANPSSVEPAETRTCDMSVITEYVRARYQEGRERSLVQKALQQAGWSKTETESVLNTVYGAEEKPSLGWLVWVIIIVVVVAIAILVAWKFVFPKGKKAKAKAEAYPELTSYIRDAQAAGATKAEIVSKLQEAGWPREAIEESFKAV